MRSVCTEPSCRRPGCSMCCTPDSSAFGSGGRSSRRTRAARCNACRNVWRLRLKAIGHYGAFLQQTVGSRVQAAGREVILVHRLLKNQVPQKADYALLTRPALEYMDVDPARLGLLPHTERYEHFGDVECFVGDLAYATSSTALR